MSEIHTPKNTELGTNTVPILAAILAILLWSGTAVANKVAVGYQDGLSVGFIRSIAAGCIALPAAFFLRANFPKTRNGQALLFVSGILSFAAWPVLLSFGLARTSASHAAMIMAVIPLLTVLISAVIMKRPPAVRWWIGSSIAFVATAILISTRSGDDNFTSQSSGWSGDLLIVLGCLACAGGYVSGGKVTAKIGAIGTTIWGLVIASFCLAPFSFWVVDWSTFEHLPLVWWASMGWMVLLSSLLGYALWFFALAKSGATKIATLQFAMPVTALAASVMLLGDPFSVAMAMLSALIVGGTFFAQNQSNLKTK